MSDLAAHHSVHPPGFAHQFEQVDQQRDAGTLGMWVFLITEIMFFGGMFAAYTIYRSLHLLFLLSALLQAPRPAPIILPRPSRVAPPSSPSTLQSRKYLVYPAEIAGH